MCIFLLFGPGRFFFAVWAGSLTFRSAWLLFKRPNNKKDQTARKKNFPRIKHLQDQDQDLLVQLFLLITRSEPRCEDLSQLACELSSCHIQYNPNIIQLEYKLNINAI